MHSKTENPKQSNETPFWSRFGSKIESRLYFGRDFNSETDIGCFVSDFRFYWALYDLIKLDPEADTLLKIHRENNNIYENFRWRPPGQ